MQFQPIVCKLLRYGERVSHQTLTLVFHVQIVIALPINTMSVLILDKDCLIEKIAPLSKTSGFRMLESFS